jgi:hypothetical protein
MASPWCRSCRPEGGTTVHVLWECEALATLSQTYLGYSLLDPEDVLYLNPGATGALLKEQHSHDLYFNLKEYKGPVKGICPSGSDSNPSSFLIYAILSICTSK